MAGFDALRFGLLAIVVTPALQAPCGSGRFGEACRYSCNCQVGCDQITGACPGSCSAGWVKTGQLCQKENIAYKKTASSTTKTGFLGWSPRNAVDGNNNINGESSTCFHGDEGRNELTIDLGDHYKLYYIRFYLRHEFNRRIANSLIYLDGVRSKVCYTFPPSVPNNPTDVVCDDVARFLTIENPGTGARDNTPLNICEIEIYHCSNGTFGENCNFFCHCGSCDVTTGVCTGICFAGWMGESILQVYCKQLSRSRACFLYLNERALTKRNLNVRSKVCDSKHYGIKCLHDCESRHCVPRSSCNRFTGRCDMGCLPGWRGEDCTQQCDSRYYGQNCSKVCTDRNCYGSSDCNHVTGSCNNGCGEGWTGTDCRKECVDSYGFNCNMTCGDRKCARDMASCDQFTGSCDPCLSGWEGVDCTEKVPDVADASESTTTDKRTVALSTTVGVFAVIIVIFTVFFLRLNLGIHFSDKRSEGDKRTAPDPSPTADHIYTDVTPSNTNSSTAPATYEFLKPTEDNQYTELQGGNYYGNT